MRDSKLHYLSVCMQKEKVKKQSWDKKLLPKGDGEGVPIHSQNNTHPCWPVLIISGVRAMY